MRILIGGGITFLSSLHAFSEKLSECGVECKVVMDRDYIADFPSKELRGLFRTRKKFEKLLYTTGTPNPDLIIRTGGQKRISNFLLWQSAYSEMYFTSKLWPDFNKKDVIKALNDFKNRNRNYGKIN